MTAPVGWVTPHLSLAEVGCKDGTPYPVAWADRLAILGREFERIRGACLGQPITVLSAYRTGPHNAAAGGSPRSQHCEGRALDLAPPTGMTPAEMYSLVRRLVTLYPDSKIRGLGLYPSWGIHIDTRPGQGLTTWTS